MYTHRTRQLTSLLALFALLWGLVFPTLANAGFSDTNEVWAEVCTAQGIKKVHLDSGKADSSHHYSAEHCSLCCLGGSLPATAPASLLGELDFSRQALPQPSLQTVPPQRWVLLTAAPRAPPILF